VGPTSEGAVSASAAGLALVQLVWEFWVMGSPYRALTALEAGALALGIRTVVAWLIRLYGGQPAEPERPIVVSDRIDGSPS
jgi:hypothetical protein